MDPNRPNDDQLNPGTAASDRTAGASYEQPTFYEKPTLTSYGSLARLTRSGAGTTSDAKGAKRMV